MARQKDSLYTGVKFILSQRLRSQPLLPSFQAKWCRLHRGVIGEKEYKQKKAQLINKKFDNLDGGNPDGDWLEHLKNFLTLAHQASYIAAEANPDAQRDFLQKIVSNLKLLDGNLIVSYTSAFKIHAESHGEDMGSLLSGNRKNFRSKYT